MDKLFIFLISLIVSCLMVISPINSNECSNSGDIFGSNVVNQSQYEKPNDPDQHNTFILVDKGQIECSGYIQKWKFWMEPSKCDTLYFQVYREVNSTTQYSEMRLIGEYKIDLCMAHPPLGSGNITLDVPPEYQIFVEPGDYIAWRQENNAEFMAYEEGCVDCGEVVRLPCSTVTVGGVCKPQPGNQPKTERRNYSLQAVIYRGCYNMGTSMGAQIMDRGKYEKPSAPDSTGRANTFFLLEDGKALCSGYIKQWKIWKEGNMSDIVYFQVYRESLTSTPDDPKYELIEENIFDLFNITDIGEITLNVSKADQIFVQGGDVIAWRQENNAELMTYTENCYGCGKILRLPCRKVPPGSTCEQLFDPVFEKRDYSFQAIVYGDEDTDVIKPTDVPTTVESTTLEMTSTYAPEASTADKSDDNDDDVIIIVVAVVCSVAVVTAAAVIITVLCKRSTCKTRQLASKGNKTDTELKGK